MQEIEYKWRVRSLQDYQRFLRLAKDLGVKLSKPKKVQIDDLYLDTPEKFFQSTHLQCRIRRSNTHSELTVKSFPNPKQGIFIRKEKSVPLPQTASMKATLAYCRKSFFKNVRPLFDISNERLIHVLTFPCGTRAEASFDQVVMSYGKSKFRMNEIELEFKEGDVEALKAFAGQVSSLHLIPSKSSKYQVAITHLPIDMSPGTIDTFNDTANGVLKTNLKKLQIKEADAAKGLDVEMIHAMRVSTRRLRAAIKTFKKILPAKAKKIRAKLQKLGGLLGKKRDLDVFSEFILQSVSARSTSYQKLVRLMEQSQKKILAMINSKFYAGLIKSLEKLKAEKSNRNVLRIATARIQKELDRVLKMGSHINAKANDRDLHALRISLKKLRYTCEFFELVFSKSICSLGAFIEKTKTLQDILGGHQDAITGMAMLNRYKSRFSEDEFNQIKENYELKKKNARKSFFKIWKDYWVGNGFRQSQPTNAIELILV